MSVVELSSLPIRLVMYPWQEIKKLLFFHSTYAKYVRLSAEVDRLQKQWIEQKELSLENNRLQELLDFKQRMVYPSVGAHVVGRDPSSWSSSVIIDRGKKHGIRQGMPVVSGLGVIGKVVEVGAFMSRVILLTDPNFSAGAVVQRTRENGLVTGTLQGLCRMKYISSDADIKAGDKIITSKLSYFFPEGFLIGVVKRVEESQSSPTLECLIAPAVNLSELEEVLVLLTGPSSP